jgi:phytoene/squalene synthetase
MSTLYSDVAFKVSKLVTVTYSTSFSIAVRFLQSDLRKAIYSIYGFVRFADEIVDTFHCHNKAFLLEKFERDFYEGMEQGISLNPEIINITPRKERTATLKNFNTALKNCKFT